MKGGRIYGHPFGYNSTTRAVSKILFLKNKFICSQHYSVHIKWLFEVHGPQICQQGMINSNNLSNFVINYDKTLKISFYPHHIIHIISTHIHTYPHHKIWPVRENPWPYGEQCWMYLPSLILFSFSGKLFCKIYYQEKARLVELNFIFWANPNINKLFLLDCIKSVLLAHVGQPTLPSSNKLNLAKSTRHCSKWTLNTRKLLEMNANLPKV